MRRSGETWRLIQEMRDVEAGGVPRRRMLYIDFEDGRLLPLARGDPDLFLDALYRRFPQVRGAI